MACLDDSTVLRLVTGRLVESEYRVAEEELEHCDRCARLVAAFAPADSSSVVAVKILDGDSPGLEARFAREIRVTASLQHPGVVPIYDSGTLSDGRLFYAMRHVPGSGVDRVMVDVRDEGQRFDLLVSVISAAGLLK